MSSLSNRDSVGYAYLQVVLSAIAIVTGIVIGASVLGDRLSTSGEAASADDLIHKVRNDDVDITLENPRKSGTVDYIMPAELCFNLVPPTANGKYRIAMYMNLKDEEDPSVVREMLIGASSTKLITNNHTLDCSSRVLRKDAVNIPFHMPDEERWAEDCPIVTIKVETEGRWNPEPEHAVATLGPEFFCPDEGTSATAAPSSAATAVPSSANTSATAAPSAAPSTTTTTPTPQNPYSSNSTAIEGRVTVYSCIQPTSTQVTICTDNTNASCTDIPYVDHPSDQGIWLADASGDRTYIYQYKITKDSQGDDLESGTNYAIHSAHTRIALGGGRNVNMTSSKEEKVSVTVPGKHDLTIHAGVPTCPCVFHALSHVYVRNSAGELVTTNEIDEVYVLGQRLIKGSANAHQIITRGNQPVLPFTNGSLDVLQDLKESSYDIGTENPAIEFPYSGGHGIDSFAYVRLFAPDHDVVGQVCESKGSKHACPGMTYKWSKTFTNKAESNKDIKGLRVGCDVDLEYGWIVERKGTTSTPVPSQQPSQQPTQQPSQSPSQGPSQSPSQGVPQFNDVFGSLSCPLRNDMSEIPENQGCKPRNLRVEDVKEITLDLSWDAPSNCSAFRQGGTGKYWVIVKDSNNRVVSSRKNITDLDTSISSRDDRQNEGLPVSIHAIEKWTVGEQYSLYVYAYIDGSSPLCVGRPLVGTFEGEDQTGNDFAFWDKPASYEYQEADIPLEDMDFNKDKIINSLDLAVCAEEYNKQGKKLTCDVTGDGIVNALDYSAVISSHGREVSR